MMTINGKTLDSFGARLRVRDVGLSEAKIYRAWADNSLHPFISTYRKIKWKPMNLLIEFAGDWATREEAKSDLHEELLKGSLIFDDEPDREYFYVLNGTPLTIDSYPIFESVSYDLACYKQDKDYTTLNLVNGSNSVVVTKDAVVRLSLKAVTNGTATATINGKVITMTGLKTTVFRVFENGTVTENGSNVWSSTALVSFPTLHKGTNSITLSNATGTIQYKRRYS